MKRALSCILAIIIIIGLFPTAAFAVDSGEIVSRAAVLIDAATGEILFAKNANQRMYPASITKILTGLLVVENTSMNDVMTAQATSSVGALPRGYSNINLQAGERMVVHDAMYALMLKSANEVGFALAEHVSGSQSGFANLMNQRARELGATGSNFVNASGIPNNDHYTTAYDMALITRAASRNATMMQYMSALDYTLPSTNMRSSTLNVPQHHLMMFQDEPYYNADVVAGKIGYTDQAQHTMSTVATRNGRTLICVVMGSTRVGKYTDTQRLLDYGFSQDDVYSFNLFDNMPGYNA